jgi:hypothetical protein
MTTAQDGGKVSLKHRPPLPTGNTPKGHWYCAGIRLQKLEEEISFSIAGNARLL